MPILTYCAGNQNYSEKVIAETFLTSLHKNIYYSSYRCLWRPVTLTDHPSPSSSPGCATCCLGHPLVLKMSMITTTPLPLCPSRPPKPKRNWVKEPAKGKPRKPSRVTTQNQFFNPTCDMTEQPSSAWERREFDIKPMQVSFSVVLLMTDMPYRDSVNSFPLFTNICVFIFRNVFHHSSPILPMHLMKCSVSWTGEWTKGSVMRTCLYPFEFILHWRVHPNNLMRLVVHRWLTRLPQNTAAF